MADSSRSGSPPGIRLEILAVVAIALAASLAGLGNSFAQDDLPLIADHERLHQLAQLPSLLGAPFWPPPYSEDLYRPLTTLLLGLEWAIGGGSPLLYRAVSIGLYAASAVAVLLLARRVLPGPLALVAALLFAAHPVHTEATALAVAQNELLVGLLAAVIVVRYLQARADGARGPSWSTWFQLGLLYLAASLLKETGLVLVGLLLAAEVFLVPARPNRWRRLAPGYALLLLVPVAVLVVRAAVFPDRLSGSFTAEALEGQGIAGRALTMLTVVPEWVRLLLFPLELQADYAPREIVPASALGPGSALGLLVVLGAIAVVWRSRRTAPVVSFGVAWTLIALAPVSNALIPTGIVLAERTLFLPSIGVLLALGGLLEPLWRSLAGRPGQIRLAVAASVLVAGLGVVRSALRLGDWRSEPVYTERTVQDAPRSWRAQKAYGALLFARGQETRALAAYDRSLALAPRRQVWRVRNDLALRYWEAGKNREAARQLRLSLAEAPDIVDTRQFLVVAHLALGEYAEAMGAADSALGRGGDPALFGSLRALADTARRTGAPPGSIRIRIRTGVSPPR